MKDRAGILLMLQAKPGMEDRVERFLRGTEGNSAELNLATYFVFKTETEGRFGIFYSSEDEKTRRKHRTGRIASVLFATARELFDPLPIGENIEIMVMRTPRVAGLGLTKEQTAGLAKSLTRDAKSLTRRTTATALAPTNGRVRYAKDV